MDSLEKFIRNNKEELNQFEPKSDVWDKIDEALNEEDNTPKLKGHNRSKSITITYKTMWMVAASILILLVGIWSIQRFGSANEKENNIAETKYSLQEVNPELAEAETYYVSLIKEKRAELAELAPEELDAFDKELKTLDSMYVGLKKEFFKTANREQIAEAMIENLRIRTKILNRQIEILEKYQSKSTKGHENTYL